MDNKILLITADYAPRVGGVARYYEGLKNSLPQINVLTSSVGPKEERVIRTNWAWPIWPKWLPLLWLTPYFKLKTKVKFLAAGEILPVGTALLLTHWAFGWPYVVFLHGFDIQLAQASLWKKFLTRQILRYAHRVIVNSEFTRVLAVSAGAIEAQIIVVYPCTNLNLPAPLSAVTKLRQKYNLVGKTVLLSVARLVRRKGIDRIINLIPKLQVQFPNLVYVVVGEGAERCDLELRIKKEELRVLFIGRVDDEELASWYSACDIFVLTPRPSLTDVEGFGIAYLEAQAAGKPIVASKVGGVAEAVGESGYLANNDEEIYFYLTKLLQNQDLQKNLGRQGYERVLRQFTKDAQSAKLIQLL